MEEDELIQLESGIMPKENQKKKSRQRMLGKDSKKYKRLIKRFEDEEVGDDDFAEDQKQQKGEKQNDKVIDFETNEPVKQKKVKKNDGAAKPKPSNAEEQQGKVFIKDVFSEILNQEVKQEFQKNPMLAKFRKPIKKVKQLQKKEKALRLRKRIKELKELRGFINPLKDDLTKDKELKIVAVKGVIKILSAIQNFQQASQKGGNNDEEQD